MEVPKLLPWKWFASMEVEVVGVASMEVPFPTSMVVVDQHNCYASGTSTEVTVTFMRVRNALSRKLY